MGVDGKTVEVFAHVAVEGGVLGQQLAELVSLVVVGKVTEDQQFRHLDEGGAGGEVLDGDPAVSQDAAFTVDEGDGRAAGAGVAVGVVEGDQAGGGTQPRDVHRPLPLGSGDEGQLVGDTIYDQGHGIGHRGSFVSQGFGHHIRAV